MGISTRTCIESSKLSLASFSPEKRNKVLRILGGKPYIINNGNVFVSSLSSMNRVHNSGREIDKLTRARLRIADRFLRKDFIAFMFKEYGEEYTKDYFYERYTDLVDGLEHPQW